MKTKEEKLEEINKDMFEMIDKNLNKRYITSGSFIRFRNKCIEFGQLAERKRCLKMIEEFCNYLEKETGMIGFSKKIDLNNNAFGKWRKELTKKVSEEAK